MFTRIVTSALFAGFAAGLIAALLQLYFVQPILLHAELYENGDLVHFGADSTYGKSFNIRELNPVRDGISVLFSALLYTGYALMLVAAMAAAEDQGAKITPRNGLLWGLAGFLAVHFLPALGLPSELPGSAYTDLVERQVWWFGTVAVSGLAIWLIAFGKSWSIWSAAIALLVLPHLIGAPHPDSFSGPAPPELAALFTSRSLGVYLAAWVFLGLFSAHFWQRENQS